MKKIFALTVLVCAAFIPAAVYAETAPVSTEPEKTANTDFLDLGDEGLQKNSLMIFGGAGKTLYGYTDVRYKDIKDQGDYIPARYEYGGAELGIAGIGDLSTSVKELRLGGNIVVLHKGAYGERSLYAVPLHAIPLQTFPIKDTDKTGHFKFIPGFFAGLDLKWWGLDCGISVLADAIYEKSRYKLDPASDPANPVYNKVNGRGWIYNDVVMYLNFSARLGTENAPHFLFYFMRYDYDPVYGKLQAKLVLPLHRFFNLNVGSYLYPAQAFYLEPVIHFGGASIGIKGGAIVNYTDRDIVRAAIKDSFFASASAAYSW